MIRNDAKGDVLNRVCAIFFARKSFRSCDEIAHQIDVVVGKHALNDRRDPLESHARVYMFIVQILQFFILSTVVLNENQIP